MDECQRDHFVEAFDLDEPAETTSIRPLITDETDYSYNPLEADDDPTGHPTRHQPATTQHSGSMMASPPSTRCMSIRAISNASMPPSRRTTSGSTSSSLPPSGVSKSVFSGSSGIISAVQCKLSSTHPNDTGNRSSFDVVCSQPM